MATTGIYMVVRCNVLFRMSPAAMNVVAITGCVTAILAASMALVQNDIKKVLAYSTISQLGYMFLGCGVGAFVGGIFHVFTHAFFKACLFLGSGSVIHAMAGEQDMRKMGGLKEAMPTTRWTYLVSTLAIAGIFPFAGFFSKDEILGEAFGHHRVFLWGIAIVAAVMTAFYMFRSYFMTFTGTFRGTEEQKHHLHESPGTMTWPLRILAVGAVLAGLVGLPEVLGAILHVPHALASWLASTAPSSRRFSSTGARGGSPTCWPGSKTRVSSRTPRRTRPTTRWISASNCWRPSTSKRDSSWCSGGCARRSPTSS